MSKVLQHPAIEAINLSKAYPGILAVEQVSFTVGKGHIHGLLGPNGAGKSTTIKMICGLLSPTGGRVQVAGLDPQVHLLAVKSKIGLCAERPPLYEDMTVKAYLRYVGSLFGLKDAVLSEAVARCMEQTGLGAQAMRLIGHLSKGYRQRVGIAQALVHDPEILVLDEPTSGLDAHSVLEIRELVRSFKGKKTLVFSSHILAEVEALCDSITIIDQGQMKAHGPLSEVRSKLQHKRMIRVVVKECPQAVITRLQQISGVGEVIQEKHFPVVILRIAQEKEEDIRPHIVRSLVENKLDVLEVQEEVLDLERIFLKLTSQGGSR